MERLWTVQNAGDVNCWIKSWARNERNPLKRQRKICFKSHPKKNPFNSTWRKPPTNKKKKKSTSSINKSPSLPSQPNQLTPCCWVEVSNLKAELRSERASQLAGCYTLGLGITPVHRRLPMCGVELWLFWFLVFFLVFLFGFGVFGGVEIKKNICCHLPFFSTKLTLLATASWAKRAKMAKQNFLGWGDVSSKLWLKCYSRKTSKELGGIGRSLEWSFST